MPREALGAYPRNLIGFSYVVCWLCAAAPSGDFTTNTFTLRVQLRSFNIFLRLHHLTKCQKSRQYLLVPFIFAARVFILN